MIEIELTSEEVKAVLHKLNNRLKRRKRLMRAIAGTMEAAVLQNFEAGGRPAWLGVKHREGKPLVDTENLMSSIESTHNNDEAVVGTNVAYAAIHQFGGKAGRGKKVDIPARPFLMLAPEDEQDILDDVQDYFRSIIK